MQKKEAVLLALGGALIIIWIIGFLAVLNGKALWQNTQIKSETANKISDEIIDCIKKTTYDGLNILGKQGRIYPPLYMETNDTKIAYLYYEGTSFVPQNMNVISQELTRHVNENLPYCIDIIKEKYYEDENITFSYADKIYAFVSVDDQYVFVNMKYPIILQKEGREETIADFEAVISFKLFKAFDLAREIVKRTQNDPKWIDLEILSNEELIVRLEKINENTLIYTITTPLGLDAKPFTYRFAVKY
ncbi:MAG: hypothetical protein V1859_11340 [archaeon]